MQLRSRHRSIRKALALATCTILSQVPHQARAADNQWTTELSSLYYTEADRFTVNETETIIEKAASESEFVRLKLVYDSMTGASANGAVFTSNGGVQTITSPSGSVNVAPGGGTGLSPLTPFVDTRTAVAFDWSRRLLGEWRGKFGGTASFENDYTSLGGSGTFSWDFNQRLTTFTTGLSLTFDTVRPVGGAPGAFDSVTVGTRYGPGEKRVADAIIGLSQVLSRRMLTQINYAVGMSDGYLTDPYKVLSVIDPTSGDPSDHVYENRPTSRRRNSAYWETKYQFTEDVLTLAYRYYWDEWAIRSHTVDLKYHYELANGMYLQPRLRYYAQTAADFYRYSLTENDPLPMYASADYRLGNLNSATVGLKFGAPLGKKGKFGLRAEYLVQRDGEERFPDVNGFILQGSFIFLFLTFSLWTRPPPR